MKIEVSPDAIEHLGYCFAKGALKALLAWLVIPLLVVVLLVNLVR